MDGSGHDKNNDSQSVATSSSFDLTVGSFEAI